MTTIVANLECMAADQRCTDEGPPFCHTTKIHRVGNSIFGLAGDVMAGLAVLEWLGTAKRSKATLYKMFGEDVQWRYEFVLLELSAEGLALWNAWGVRMPILDSIYGIGTGAAVAVDAMANNAKPDDAIRRAMQRDQFSGVLTEPQVEYLLPPELAKRTKRKRG